MKVNERPTKWEDVWELPLSKYEYVDYVDSSNGVLTLSHFKDEWTFDEDDAAINKIVSIINGEMDSDFLPEWEADGCDILYQGAYAFCVRGWGYLTGTGGLNLPEGDAEKIQDEFISYILSRLNGNPKIN